MNNLLKGLFIGLSDNGCMVGGCGGGGHDICVTKCVSGCRCQTQVHP
jgi:hypothetical protein